MTREYLRPFTSSDEAFMTLANINCCVSSRARGRVGSYQLSVFGFQIVAVFGRIRIVHLAHYSVRFEFESNIRHILSKLFVLCLLNFFPFVLVYFLLSLYFFAYLLPYLFTS